MLSTAIMTDDLLLFYLFTKMAETQKPKRKIWTKEETLIFLECYKERQNEFKHARKKRNAYANVLESMIYKGFQDTSVTPTALEGKMRNLLVAYKAANDNSNQTGASPCTAPYFEQLDEIFGDKPCQSNRHTINVGTTPVDACTEYEFLIDFDETETSATSISPLFEIVSPLSSTPINSVVSLSPSAPPRSASSQASAPSTSFGPSSLTPPSTSFGPSTSTPPSTSPAPLASSDAPAAKKPKYKSARERYYERKLELKREQLARKDLFYKNVEKFMQARLNKNKE